LNDLATMKPSSHKNVTQHSPLKKSLFPMAVIRRKGKLNPNLLLQEVSGMLGGLVIKRYKDKIVLSNPPTKRTKKPSILQKERQRKMKEAVRFARRINEDPIQKASWKKLAKAYSNVYQAAVAWYLKNGDDLSLMPPDVAKTRRSRLLG